MADTGRTILTPMGPRSFRVDSDVESAYPTAPRPIARYSAGAQHTCGISCQLVVHLRAILPCRGALAGYPASGAPSWHDIGQVCHFWQDMAQVWPHLRDILPFSAHLRDIEPARRGDGGISHKCGASRQDMGQVRRGTTENESLCSQKTHWDPRERDGNQAPVPNDLAHNRNPFYLES